MKKLLYVPVFTALIACGSDEAVVKSDTVRTGTVKIAEKTDWPDYPLPVEFVDWSVGNPENSRMIVELYKAWDDKDAKLIATYFADSTAYDLPDGTRAATTKDNVYNTFKRWRGGFGSTSHHVIYALPLRSNDHQQDWVIAMVYNKWSYKDGVRDSMLYIDQWRFDNGKVAYLNSLEQKPSKQLLRRLKEMDR